MTARTCADCKKPLDQFSRAPRCVRCRAEHRRRLQAESYAWRMTKLGVERSRPGETQRIERLLAALDAQRRRERRMNKS